jgi:hypothetical protein
MVSVAIFEVWNACPGGIVNFLHDGYRSRTGMKLGKRYLAANIGGPPMQEPSFNERTRMDGKNSSDHLETPVALRSGNSG